MNGAEWAEGEGIRLLVLRVRVRKLFSMKTIGPVQLAPHSWVWDLKYIDDTEPGAERYFGVQLLERDAIQCWYTHYLPERYPGPASLILRLGEAQETSRAPGSG